MKPVYYHHPTSTDDIHPAWLSISFLAAMYEELDRIVPDTYDEAIYADTRIAYLAAPSAGVMLRYSIINSTYHYWNENND